MINGDELRHVGEVDKSPIAFVVIAWNRPNYLYIVLSSIFRIVGIEGCPVFVAVDGEGGREEEIKSVLSQFPLSGWLIRDRRFRPAKHYVTSIRAIMDYGYEEVVYIAEDLLVRPDALRYLQQAERDGFFLCLKGTHNVLKEGHYSGWGDLVQKETFGELYDYVISGEYIGEMDWLRHIPLTAKAGEDTVFSTFMRARGKSTRFPDKAYTVHFGLRGLNYTLPNAACLELEKELFSGPRDRWLDNAIAIVERTYDDPLVKLRIDPEGFKYYE